MAFTPSRTLYGRISSRWIGVSTAIVLLAGAVPAVGPGIAGAQACPVISGFVYYDVNDNGLKESGEAPIAGTPIELRNEAGAMVGATTTAADGSYTFVNDGSPGLPSLTESHKVVFPKAITDWSAAKAVPQFDPAKGALKSVKVTAGATIESSIKAESLDGDPTTITATVSGVVTLQAPGIAALKAEPNDTAGSFDAPVFDGSMDFAGPSAHDFGTKSASDSTDTTLTGGAIGLYSGLGTVTLKVSALADSRTTGGGNLINEIHTTALADVTVVYTYTPPICIKDGKYTIVETSQPAGYSDGLETAGNTAPIPNTRSSDKISVTLAGQDLAQNNFGELKASIHGCVYVDANDNGIKEPGEPPIPLTMITLGGAEARTMETGGDGCYDFQGLAGGTYTVSETQPAGFVDGKDTIGSLGGKTTNDRHFDIVLPGGKRSVNNNFGERLPNPSVTPASPPQLGGTPTPGGPGSGSNTPAGPGGGPGSPTEGAAGEKTPGVPAAGSGLLSRAMNMNLVILGFAVFAASGWLAFLAVQRREREDVEVSEDE